jgi:hypothetical protein
MRPFRRILYNQMQGHRHPRMARNISVSIDNKARRTIRLYGALLTLSLVHGGSSPGNSPVLMTETPHCGSSLTVRSMGQGSSESQPAEAIATTTKIYWCSNRCLGALRSICEH